MINFAIRNISLASTIFTYIENLYRTSPNDYFWTWQICHSKFNPKLLFCIYTMTYSCVEWLFTVTLPEHREESCSKQVLYLKSWWMQQNSNPKPLTLWANAYLYRPNGQLLTCLSCKNIRLFLQFFCCRLY